MKKFIMATVIAACIALCAAVWPQNKVVEETPAPTQTPTVCAPETTVAELKTEIEIAPPPEKEKVEIPKQEPHQEVPAKPKPTPIETPTVPKAQPTPEPKVTAEVAPEPTHSPSPEPTAAQTTIEPQSDDMVYVPGFGWIESQGPNQVEYAEDMYENGNKIGSMG